MLGKYLEPQDWDCIYFNNEFHFLWGAQHQLQIFQSSDSNIALNIRNTKRDQSQKIRKKFYCWVVIGYNFESHLTF